MDGWYPVDEIEVGALMRDDHSPYCKIFNGGGLYCTRATPHTGDHVACSASRVLARWPPLSFPREPVDSDELAAVHWIGKPLCLNTDGRDQLGFCFRRKGHQGDHIAASGGTIFDRWPASVVTPAIPSFPRAPIDDDERAALYWDHFSNCGTRNKKRDLFCTRKPEHNGDHIAGSIIGEIHDRWLAIESPAPTPSQRQAEPPRATLTPVTVCQSCGSYPKAPHKSFCKRKYDPASEPIRLAAAAAEKPGIIRRVVDVPRGATRIGALLWNRSKLPARINIRNGAGVCLYLLVLEPGYRSDGIPLPADASTVEIEGAVTVDLPAFIVPAQVK